jgi:predicted house-cleaning NTP pyrophosphatase (Maf/HAM1 superfamily)
MFHRFDNEIILASASPRRLQLLQQIGVHARVLAVPVEEIMLSGEPPLKWPRRNHWPEISII